jgi:hypothetical protein
VLAFSTWIRALFAAAAAADTPAGGRDTPPTKTPNLVQEMFWGPQAPEVTKQPSGELFIFAEGKLLCNRLVGHFDQPLADRVMARGDSLLAKHGELIVFSDWSHMTSYDSSCRRTMTEWGSNLGKRLLGFNVIAGTQLVKMGLAVASIVVPALRMHNSSATFAAAYYEAKRAASGVRVMR